MGLLQGLYRAITVLVYFAELLMILLILRMLEESA